MDLQPSDTNHMTAAIPSALQYYAPPDPGKWRAILFAAVVHMALFAFLWIGVRWQSEVPVAEVAEVWDMPTREEAPKEQVPVPPPRPAVVEEQKIAPEIALAQERKHKADLKAEADAQRAKELEEKANKKKLEKEIKAKEAAEKKAHDDEVARMVAGFSPNNNGTATQSTSAKANQTYLDAIRAKIKSKHIYTGSTNVTGNPRAIFKIEQLPSGEISSIKKIKGSEIPAFDDSVEKAITNSSPLPKRKDGTVTRELDITFNFKDLL